MPKPFPKEFRRDVVAVARKGEQSIAQVAKDFGISESCLHRWLKIADREDGVAGRRRPAAAAARSRPRTAGAAQADRAAGAGERDPAPGDGLLRPRRPPKMMYPLVLDLAADGIPVAVTCRVLGFSKQAFYKWRANPVTRPGLGRRAPDQRRARHPPRRSRVRLPVHRRRARPTRASPPARTGSHRLCSPAADLVGARHEARPEPQARPAGARRPGRARRSPRRAPNELWLTDITEHPTAEGKLYLCAIKDVCSNRIVGYSIDSRMTAAAGRRRAAQRDRAARPGRHRSCTPTAAASFAPTPSSARCATHGLRGSMGRVGACGDNAAMESFFALLQKNVLNRRRWATRERAAPGDRHLDRDGPTTADAANDALGRLTPIEFETLQPAAHAA